MTSSANATFSDTVLLGSSRKSWKTVPICRRSAGTFQLDNRFKSLPATCTWPPVARSRAGRGEETSTCQIRTLPRGRRTRPDQPRPRCRKGRPMLVRIDLADVLEADHGFITGGQCRCRRELP